MTKIELVDILPTKQEIVNYGKYISSLNLRSGNEVDYESVIELLINDMRNAKIGTYCFDILKEMKSDL